MFFAAQTHKPGSSPEYRDTENCRGEDAAGECLPRYTLVLKERDFAFAAI
jgi:hypothetical protein